MRRATSATSSRRAGGVVRGVDAYLEGGAAASNLLGRHRGDAGALEGGLGGADEGRGLEGLGRLEESKGNNSGGLHLYLSAGAQSRG